MLLYQSFQKQVIPITIIFTTKKRLLLLTLFIALCVVLPITLFQFEASALYNMSKLETNETKYIAIIIDDFGNNGEGTEELLTMNIAITAAIMPALPSSQKDEEEFHKAKKGVMLHMPMESQNGKRHWLGPMAITTDLTPEEAAKNVRQSLDDMPYVTAVNNHMGSKITEDKEIITEVVKVIREKDLIIVDSMTSSKSVFLTTAQEYGVRCYARDVFLDGTKNISLIEKQIIKTAEVANKKGYAIAIGHVGAAGGMATVKAIQNLSPKLKEMGYVFVTIEQLDSILALEF